MPFQVTFSQKSIPSGVIQSISAGEDGLTVCDPGYTLEATVIGDLNGHTVLWEQIEGSSVTFSGPVDTLIVSYTQTNFDNKKFRFYVDKGLASEKFDDVVIFGSPTSKTRIGFSVPSTTKVNSTTNLNGDTLKLNMLSPFPLVQHNGEVECGTYTDGYFTWAAPDTIGSVIDYTVQSRNNTTGIWSDVVVLPNTTYAYPVSVLGVTYRIKANTIFPNSTPVPIYSNTFFLNGIHISGVSAVEAARTAPSNVSPTVYTFGYDIEKISLVTKSIDPEQTKYSTSVTPLVTSYGYHVESLSLTTKVIDPESVVRSFTVAPGVITSNYDVTVLIGGQVGGS